jgi:hypothetical protein
MLVSLNNISFVWSNNNILIYVIVGILLCFFSSFRIIEHLAKEDELFTVKTASMHWKTSPLRGPCASCVVS